MVLKVCIAGVTGGVGRALVAAVEASAEFSLVGAVARSVAGQDVGHALGGERTGLKVSATLEEALGAETDVLIDYTHPDAILGHIDVAFGRGVAVVIGTTGLMNADFEAIDAKARAAGLGAATGNFSLTAALLQHFALEAAKHLETFEVFDFCKFDKPDAPSGTARELAEKLAHVRKPEIGVPLDDIRGPREARGATVEGVQCHSVRLPGFGSAVEVILGTGDERLTLRHDAISAGRPYVAGSLLAAQRITETTGLVRGLDTLLFGEP